MAKFFLFLLGAISSVAWTDPPPIPSAGVVERELEKEYEAQPLQEGKEIPSIQIDIPEERLQMPGSLRVWVDEIEIEGNEAVRRSQIERWICDSLNCDLSLQEIYAICERINREYAKKGYFLARTYPPPQTIEQGKLTLRILEGRLGSVAVEGNAFYSEPFIQSYFASMVGKPLCYHDFLQALMLLNENPDLKAAVLFRKGEEVGSADVLVRVQDSRPVHLYLNGNNYGKDLTTNFRVGGRFDAGSVLKYGDLFSFAEVIGFPVHALYFTDVIYRVPLNAKGTSLELAYLFSKFKIEELLSLRLRGQSNIGTIKMAQAWSRSRFMSIDFFWFFDYKQIQNFVLGSRTSFDKLRVLTLGSLIDRFKSRKGRDYLNMRLAIGIPNFLGGLKAIDAESSRPGAGGRFVIFNADYDHLQRLGPYSLFTFHASGQWSPYKLTVPEQIYIGGADTVRGFPLASALGDSGYYLNFQFLLPLPRLTHQCSATERNHWRELVQWVLFLDHGGVFLQSMQNVFEWGTGLGIRVNGPWTLGLSVDVGFPLNHRDLSTAAFFYIKVTGQPF